MRKVVKTWLPIFPGFYNTAIGFHERFDDEQILDAINAKETHLPETFEKFIKDNITDYICSNMYERDVCLASVKFVEAEAIKLFPDFIFGIKMEKMVSPKEYNFATDVINCEVDCDVEKLTQKICR